jgi:hypothetical protein
VLALVIWLALSALAVLATVGALGAIWGRRWKWCAVIASAILLAEVLLLATATAIGFPADSCVEGTCRGLADAADPMLFFAAFVLPPLLVVIALLVLAAVLVDRVASPLHLTRGDAGTTRQAAAERGSDALRSGSRL